MSLTENIYKYRTEKNMSQLDLADHLGVSRQSVSKWETGAAMPELEKLVNMAALFGITLDELVTGEKPTPPAISGSRTVKDFALRELIGALLIFLAAAVLLLGLILEEWDVFLPCLYFSLVLGTIACICCWPAKHILIGCFYGAGLLYTCIITVNGGILSMLIFMAPYLIIFLVQQHLENRKNEWISICIFRLFLL